MPDIPVTQQYFPSVPLSELSDLYSKGNQRLDGKRAVIISYLPKTLRLGRDLPFNNKYVLFIEGTSQVDRIAWSFDLFLNGERIVDPAFVEVTSPVDQTEFILWFQHDVIDANRQPRCDRIRITCKVEQADQEITLTVEHNFVALLSATGLATADVVKGMSVPFSGDPETTNYLLNHLKDYLQPGTMTWNNEVIDFGVPGSDPLLKIVTAILYHNILVSQPFSSAVGIHEVSSVGIRSFFNDGEPYKGNFVNGICRIPLHILSDILTAQLQVPDFTAIDVGTGNPVYNIIRDQGIFTFNDLEGDVLRTVPQKIQDSKQRLMNDPDRFLELYHLTLFPKSAIKLAALVVKYLHECSILNQCNECKGKNLLWPFVTLEGLKDHPDFLKNILTHYFREPSNKIESFAREASRAASFVWSPAVHTILNVAPRIVRAYFAKKVVRQIDDVVNGAAASVKIFDFERIDNTAVRVDENGVPIDPQPDFDAVLGQKVYLIVETLHCGNREIIVNIQTNNDRLTGNIGESLPLLSGRDDMSVDAVNYVIDIRKATGNFDDLRNVNNDIFNSKETEYLKMDHQDKVIVKIRIKPNNSNDFHGTPASWAIRLAENTARLKVLSRLADNTPAFFGSDFSATRANGEFISVNDRYINQNDPDRIVFRVVNRNLYEIYRETDTTFWNFIPIVGGEIRRIGKINNQFIDQIQNNTANSDHKKAVYLYFDSLDNEHRVCESRMHKIRRKQRANNVPAPADRGAPIDPIQLNFTANRLQYERIDAINLFFHDKGTFVEGGADVPRRPAPIPANINNVTQTRWYRNVNQNYDRDLVDADIVSDLGIGDAIFPGLNYRSNDGSLRIRFNYQHTRRRFSNPDLFAGLLGALAQQYYRNNALVLLSFGLSYEDGSCYPSAEHVNGEAIDVDYFNIHLDDQRLIDALIDYGFRLFRVGHGMNYGTTVTGVQIIKDPAPNGLHDSHLHCTNFDIGSIHAIVGP